MSLQAIRLRNCRGFRDATIALKPLTVLLGPNSAGKSSFGQLLAAMAHAQWLHAGSAQASLTPRPRDAASWPVDLGLTADLRTRGTRDRVYVGLQTPEGWIEYGFGLDPLLSDLRLSYIAHPVGMAARPSAPASAVPTIDTATPAQSGVISSPGSTSVIPQLELTRTNEIEWREGTIKTAAELDGLVLRAALHEGGTAMLLNGRVRDDIRWLLAKLTYLRATRERPKRGYERTTGERQPIGYAGEGTASVLLEAGRDDAVFLEPPAIPTTVAEARPRIDLQWNERQETLRDAVSFWLGWLDLASAVAAVESDRYPGWVQTQVTLAPGQPALDITEVGFGLSQVLPVIVGGLMQPQRSLFIVDLPEAHLHPRPQGALADFFCALALSGRSVIVETHSEMFFHRLRLRAAMNQDLMEKIAVYFLDPPIEGLCRQPREVGLHFDDELRWPPGFLQEAWETETQLDAVRQARRPTDT